MTDSLEEMWKRFEKAVVPPDACEIQRDETRRAFYTGAFIVLQQMKKISSGAALVDQMIRWEREVLDLANICTEAPN